MYPNLIWRMCPNFIWRTAKCIALDSYFDADVTLSIMYACTNSCVIDSKPAMQRQSQVCKMIANAYAHKLKCLYVCGTHTYMHTYICTHTRMQTHIYTNVYLSRLHTHFTSETSVGATLSQNTCFGLHSEFIFAE